MLISGAYIGTDAWDHVYQGVEKAPESTRNFVKSVLGYEWLTNFGDNTGKVMPARGSSLPAITYNREWSPSVYREENADGIKPASGKTKIIMRYQGTLIPAATWYEAPTYKVAAFGFPLETSDKMEAILKTVLKKL